MQTLSSEEKDIDKTINAWIKELDKYSFAQLLTKPSPISWSPGQTEMHFRHHLRQKKRSDDFLSKQ